MKKVTITDVAQVAGVSVSTVSHALSGKRPISTKVKSTILEAVESLGYRPSLSAQVIRGGRTMVIAAMVDDLQKGSTSVTLEAFHRALSMHGYDLAVYICGRGAHHGVEMLKNLSVGMLDGIINLQPDISLRQAELAAGNIPIITYLRPHPDSPVCIDIEAGVTRSLNYLWDLGHRRIGFIGGIRIKSPEMPKDPQLAAYEAFMAERDYLEPALAHMSEGLFADGIALADVLWQAGSTAVLAANDVVAAGVFSWAKSQKLSVPGDISVIGHDDSELSKMLTPTLTTVQFPYQEVAEITCDALLNLIAGKHVAQHRRIRPALIVRDSTGIPNPNRRS